MDALRETRRRQARREIAKNAHLLSYDSEPGPIAQGGHLHRGPICE
jgi:hypothetical protein